MPNVNVSNVFPHIIDGAVYGDDAVLRIRCVCCQEEQEIWVDLEGAELWADGEPIAEVLPEVPVEVRDILETGLCHTCAVVLLSKRESVA